MAHETGRFSGIDEAGYGPLIGPLTAARAAFAAGPEDGVRARVRAAGIRVDDSKKVHAGAHALAKLETVVLAFAAIAGSRMPRSFDEFLADAATPGWQAVLDCSPWYRNRDLPWPIAASAEDVQRTCERLSACATGFRGFAITIASEADFNRRVERSANKHDALFGIVADLIARDRADGESIFVDKLGGRDRYAAKLEESFLFCPVTALEESRRTSRYRLDLPDGALEIAFMMKGDSRSFAIALASMAAKYVREALMIALNRHFAAVAPGIRPTAGYWVDGSRFVLELEERGVLDRAARAMLVRSR